MMFRKNWNGRRAEGFTLVELIVVIAILAILAGVAVPVYSGYVQKANETADYQLLAAVNTAFGAAAIENGYAAQDFDAATITLDDEGKINGVIDMHLMAKEARAIDPNSNRYLDAEETAAMYASFSNYFAGNNGFKVLGKATGKLFFNPSTGEFAADGKVVTVSYGGGKLSLAQVYLDQVKGSTFVDGVGVDKMLKKVDDVTNFVNLLDMADGGKAMEKVYSDPNFQAYMLTAIGLPADATAEQQGAALKELCEKMPGGFTQDNVNKIQANAAVLYTAAQAGSVNKSSITTLLGNDGAKQQITANLTNGQTGEAMTQAALAYGMYTAYANSSYCSEANAGAKDKNAVEVLADLDNPEFQSYINSAQGQKDMEAYLAALNMIDSSSNDKSAVTTLLTTGFGTTELTGAINGALGN